MEDIQIKPEISHKKTTIKILNKNIFISSLLSIVFFLVLGFFSFQYIAPYGAIITYHFTSEKNKDLVSGIKGAEASENIENNAEKTLLIPQQTIRKNIVTFNLKLLSQKIDGVWVNLKFKGNPKEIKIGVKGDNKAKYIYRPLYNDILESSNPEKSSEDILFWQKNKDYTSVNDLISNIPKNKIIASYYINPNKFITTASIEKMSNANNSKNVTINSTLRGSHTIYIVVDKKPLQIKIEKSDANWYIGKDDLQIDLFKDENKIVSKVIPDDGIIENSSLQMRAQTEIISADVANGIYKLVLIDNSQGADIRIKKIEINQLRAVFTSPVILDDEKTELWTDSSQINFRTARALQTIRIDDKTDINIDKPGKFFTYEPLNNINITNKKTNPITSKVIKTDLPRIEPYKVDIPKSDITIKGDGYFAFDKNAFFNPEPIKTIDLTAINDINEADYVIAKYTPVKKESEWNDVKVFFDPSDISINGDKLYFTLESPGLTQNKGEYIIKSLEVTVDKPGWGEGMLDTNNQITLNKEQKNIITQISIKVRNFLSNLWPFNETKAIVQQKVAASEKQKIALTDTPTPEPQITSALTINILNANGEIGAATKFANKLLKEGYKDKIVTGKTTIQASTIIKYRKDEKNIALEDMVKKITELLEAEYITVQKETDAANSGELTIILGKNKIVPTTVPYKRISPVHTSTSNIIPTANERR